MKEISHIELVDQGEVFKEEKARKAEYKTRQREEHVREEQKHNEMKNSELQARMARVVSKVGKPTMPRSVKKRITKEVVEVEIDEDKLDFMRYLGEDMAGLADVMKVQLQ